MSFEIVWMRAVSCRWSLVPITVFFFFSPYFSFVGFFVLPFLLCDRLTQLGSVQLNLPFGCIISFIFFSFHFCASLLFKINASKDPIGDYAKLILIFFFFYCKKLFILTESSAMFDLLVAPHHHIFFAFWGWYFSGFCLDA